MVGRFGDRQAAPGCSGFEQSPQQVPRVGLALPQVDNRPIVRPAQLRRAEGLAEGQFDGHDGEAGMLDALRFAADGRRVGAPLDAETRPGRTMVGQWPATISLACAAKGRDSASALRMDRAPSSLSAIWMVFQGIHRMIMS